MVVLWDWLTSKQKRARLPAGHDPHEWPALIQDLCCGSMLVGRTGAGKTSLIRWIIAKTLRYPCGGVWCTVKPTESRDAMSLMSKVGRQIEQRVIHFQPGNGMTFNPLAYELGRKGGSPETAMRLFEMLNDVYQHSSSHNDESFWKNLFSQTMRYAIYVAYHAQGPAVTLLNVREIIVSSPPTLAAGLSEAFMATPCGKLLKLAAERTKDKPQEREVKEAFDFFLEQLPGLGEKARGAALSQCCALLDPLLTEPLRSVVCGRGKSVTPDDVLQGYIVVLDYPVMTYGDAGKLFQLLFHYQTVQAVLSRDMNAGGLPVFSVRDEYHQICHAQFDVMAQTVARSQGLMSIVAFQTLPVLQAALGSQDRSESELHALIGCHVNKYFLSNSCPETNEYAATLCGRSRKSFASFQEDSGEAQPHDPWQDQFYGKRKIKIGASQQWHFNVPPHYFQRLRTGGKQNDYLIDYYYLRDGQLFDGKNYVLCTNDQRKELS